MELAEVNGKLLGWTIEIVATDFVEEALAKARKGVYSQFEVQRGLPVSLLVKYFNQEGSAWEVTPEIRSKVEFRAQNLLDDCQSLGVFDVIFCRNVLIYFDDATKRAVFGRLETRLARRLPRARRGGDHNRGQQRVHAGARGSSWPVLLHT